MRRLLMNERAVRFLTGAGFRTFVGLLILALVTVSVRLWGLWPAAFAVGAALSFVLGWNRAYAFWRKRGFVSKL